MFKSKQRPIAIPQWEHQKLAGTLALLWGNGRLLNACSRGDQPPPYLHSVDTEIS